MSAYNCVPKALLADWLSIAFATLIATVALYRSPSARSPLEPRTVLLDRAALATERFELRLDGHVYMATSLSSERHTDGTLTRFFLVDHAESTSISTEGKTATLVTVYLPDGSGRRISAKVFGPATVTALDFRPLACEVRDAPRSRLNPEALASSIRRRIVLPPPPLAQEAVTIRLLLVYASETPLALADPTSLPLFLQHGVDELNAMLADSGAPEIHYHLVHADLVPYTPTNDKIADLNWVGNDENVGTLRRAFQADLVGLVTAHGANIAMSPVNDNQFSIGMGFFTTSTDGFLGGFSAQHEMLHPLGAHHDAANNLKLAADEYPSARAMLLPGLKCQTVMGKYFDETGLFSNPIPRISNPDLTYQGYRTGTPDANNIAMVKIGARFVTRYHTQLK